MSPAQDAIASNFLQDYLKNISLAPISQAFGKIPQAISQVPARYNDFIDRVSPFRLFIPTAGLDSNPQSTTFGEQRPLTDEERSAYLKKFGLKNKTGYIDDFYNLIK